MSESFLRTESELRGVLARRVRELRHSSRMSQRDLAEQAGIRQALISEIERGEANVTIASLLRIAIALQVDLPGLFDGNGSQAEARRREN